MDIFASFEVNGVVATALDAIPSEVFELSARNNIDLCRTRLKSLSVCDSERYTELMVNGFNSFHIACKKGYLEMALMLLDFNKNLLTSRTSDDRNGLILAILNDHLHVVKILLSILISSKIELENYFVSKNNLNTLIHYACWSGSLTTCKYLIDECHMQYELRNKEGLLPVHLAISRNYSNIVEYMILKANSSESTASPTGYSLFHKCCLHGSLDCLKVILQYAFDSYHPSLLTSNSSTGLHLASNGGYSTIIEFLLTNYRTEINVNHQNEYGNSALMLACIHGHLDIITMLLTHGGDVNLLNSNGANGFTLAASNGRYDVCKHLFYNTNVNISILDGDGNSCIDNALDSGYKEVASKLALLQAIRLKAEKIRASIRAD